MMQFLSIRERRLHLLLSRKLERKAPIIANPDAKIGDDAKIRR
jgi:hypothetical protein